MILKIGTFLKVRKSNYKSPPAVPWLYNETLWEASLYNSEVKNVFDEVQEDVDNYSKEIEVLDTETSSTDDSTVEP